MSLLGLDIGTTGCKAGVYGLSGRLLGEGYREYDLIHPRPGWAELDSPAVWKLIRETIRQSAAAASDAGDPVTALSISAMGEAVTPVSPDGSILAGCIVPSADTRGDEYVERAVASIGVDRAYQINPNIPNAGYTAPKLAWLRDHDPDLYNLTDLFLSWPDLVQFLLGAGSATNFSHANRTLLFDVMNESWSDELVGAWGIEPAKLPEVVASGTVVGTVAAGIADDLGLPRGVAVVTGAHDQCCNALGAGVIDAGRAVCGIGTVECISPTYDCVPDLGRMRGARLNVEHHVVPDRYVSFIYNQAGSLVKWYRDTFTAGRIGDANRAPVAYDELFSELPEEPTSLLVLPYFEMTGAPTFISDASGAIIGLKTSTTRGEILKAILECETYYFAEGVELLRNLDIDTSALTATGGGAKSNAWLQIKADVLGIPVITLEHNEAGTLGAAINAGVATGVFSTPEEGVDLFVRADRRFDPRPDYSRRYQSGYARYRELYPRLKEIL